MPITVTVPATPVIGPFVSVQLSSDFIGPLPITAEWTLELLDQNERSIITRTWLSNTNPVDFEWLDDSDTRLQPPKDADINIGLTPADTLILSTSLIDGATGQLIDSGIAANWHYDGTTGLPFALNPQAQSGLTEEQAQQLESTAVSVALAELTDALLLTELTNGPTGGPLVTQLTTVTFGVIVRLDTIPADLVPQTPDGAYWVKTLATVRLFRGNDLWLRVPIHTPTKIVPFEKENLTIWVANVTLSTWLLNIHLVVDFLPGVTGRVYQMHFPL